MFIIKIIYINIEKKKILKMKNIKTFEQFNAEQLDEKFLGIGKKDTEKLDAEYKSGKFSLSQLIQKHFKNAFKMGAVKNAQSKVDDENRKNVIESAIKDPSGNIGSLRIDKEGNLIYIPYKDVKLKGVDSAIKPGSNTGR